jgi:hypothetical protein
VKRSARCAGELFGKLDISNVAVLQQQTDLGRAHDGILRPAGWDARKVERWNRAEKRHICKPDLRNIQGML